MATASRRKGCGLWRGPYRRNSIEEMMAKKESGKQREGCENKGRITSAAGQEAG
jgi:hypothetical protein